MKKTHLSLVLFLAFQLMTMPAYAVTPDIDKQQEKYQAIKTIWEKEKSPSGLDQNQLRDRTPRDSGYEGATLHIVNVNFDMVDSIGFHVKKLAVTLQPVVQSDPTAFDLVEEFSIKIHHGEIVITPESLNALFNKHIVDYKNAPLNSVKVSPEEDYLGTSAKLKLWGWFPGVWLPAYLGGEIVVNEETNELSYELDDVRALGIPLAGLLKLVHVPLTSLLDIDRPGAKLLDYSLALDYHSVFPAPAIDDRKIEKAWLDEAGLHLKFNGNPNVEFSSPPVESDSYLWLQSGDPQLYNVVVTNAGVQVIGHDKTKPLRFNLYDYRRQVSKGIVRMTQKGNIIATIPSYELLSAKDTTETVINQH